MRSTPHSSAIGLATAQRLAQRSDLTVYATVRGTRPAALDPRVTTLRLDVTDEDSMVAAVRQVEQDHGSVGALVNNAGYGEYGTIECSADARSTRSCACSTATPEPTGPAPEHGRAPTRSSAGFSVDTSPSA